MKRPVRVLFLIADLTPGGSESHLARLLVHLDRRRVAPELLVQRSLGTLLDEVRAAGVPVHALEDGGSTLGRWQRFRRIRESIGALSPDVIHSYGYLYDLYAALTAIPRRRWRIVTSRRGNQERAQVRRLYRLTNPLVDRVLCVSRATEEFAVRTERLSRRRSAVIPNGIDVGSFANARTTPRPLRRIGTVGRLRPVKGTDLLVDAFALLERSDLELILGGPADSSWGEAFRRENQGRAGVTFAGEVTDVPGFLNTLDIFVLPSRSEGMSNALLEAMSSGLPIVATDVGSNREVLADGAAGLVVAPDVASISRGIGELLEDPDRAARLGLAARRRVEQEYTLPVMLRRYEDFYEEIVR